MPTHGVSMNLSVVPVKAKGSDTARAARAAALVWGIGEGGMIWVWWGAGVSGCTSTPAAFRAPCVCVCVTCVCVKCVGAASMSAVGCPVSQLLSRSRCEVGKSEREREREREKQTDREFEDHSGSAWLQHSRGGKWRDQQSLDVGHGACLPMIMFITAEHSR